MSAVQEFLLSEIRIENFRSLEDIWIPLRRQLVLIGENNSGKTSFLDALSLAFLENPSRFSEDDVFLKSGETQPPKDRKIRIDLRIEPFAEDEFSDEARGVFGNAIQLGAGNDKDYIALRTEFAWDNGRGDFVRSRYFLQGWARNRNDAGHVNVMSQPRPRAEHFELFPFYYLDAQRDISQQLHSRRSFWGKMAEDLQLDDKTRRKIERMMDDVNELIRNGSPVLDHLRRRLDELYRTVTSERQGVEITPLPKHLRDLVHGLDILFKTRGSPAFPISRHGMGTRSMAALLVFRAFIDWQLKKSKQIQPLPIIALEEPEAHLHPHAQRALFDQIAEIEGQKLVSTHSPHVVAHAELGDFVLFRKSGEISKITWIPETDGDGNQFISPEAAHKVHQFVQLQHSELFFSRVLVLFEGETERYAMPVFAEAYFKRRADSLGISFVNVTGAGNYDPFLKIAERLKIPWVIFSDAESNAKKQLADCFNRAKMEQNKFEAQVVFLPDELDFERYLIEEGYIAEIENVIADQFGKAALKNFKTKRQGQPKKGGGTIDYNIPDAHKDALNDFIDACGKTFFGRYLAEKIVGVRKGNQRIPPKVRDLFSNVQSLLDRY